jgi:hypothetical protein
MGNQNNGVPERQKSPGILGQARQLIRRPIRLNEDRQPYCDGPQNKSATDSMGFSKSPRFKEWRRSRSRRFWILVGAAVMAALLLVICLPYFLTRPEPSTLPMRPGVIPHSYLVDIKSADDEETRLSVLATEYSWLTISTATKFWAN